MATLKVWKHPKTDEIRVYVNGLPGQGHGDKVWFEAQPVDSFGFDWAIKSSALATTHMNQAIKEDAEKLVWEAGSTITFNQIIAMAE